MSDGGAVPVYLLELVPPPDPLASCERLAGLPYRLFLDSAARETVLGSFSFLAADPIGVMRSKGVRAEYVELPHHRAHAITGNPLDDLRRRLAPYQMKPLAGLPPFQGGAAGYVAYDWGLQLERLPAPRFDDLALDDVVLGIYDWVLAWDHQLGRAWLISTGIPEVEPGARAERARRRAEEVLARLAADERVGATRDPGARASTSSGTHARQTDGSFAQESRATDGGGPAAPHAHAPSYPIEQGWWDSRYELGSSFTREAYEASVARVRDYIFAGDIFQANLSQRFEASLTEPPWTLYRRMRMRSPVAFAAFLDLPDVVVLSASPERFLRVGGDGSVETRPIKGTRPRGLGPEHDAALGRALTESVKDRAENLMIVDLMRNDLSRVCAPGSVRVTELFALERYATVHHLVSTVVGQLAPGTDALTLLRAAFPGGSITGAPKLRAMEIIAELEPSQRGVYCGSIGYWSLTGDLDTNIAIRTAVVRNGRVYFSAGGGIVADSDPGQEYLETIDKARAIIDAWSAREG